jgi:hypothetical protein
MSAAALARSFSCQQRAARAAPGKCPGLRGCMAFVKAQCANQSNSCPLILRCVTWLQPQLVELKCLSSAQLHSLEASIAINATAVDVLIHSYAKR